MVVGLPLVQISERRNGRVAEEGVVANAKEVTIGTDDVLQTIIATTETGGGKFYFRSVFILVPFFFFSTNEIEFVMSLSDSS